MSINAGEGLRAMPATVGEKVGLWTCPQTVGFFVAAFPNCVFSIIIKTYILRNYIVITLSFFAWK